MTPAKIKPLQLLIFSVRYLWLLLTKICRPSTEYHRILQYKISLQSVLRDSHWYIQTDGQTDMTKLICAFHDCVKEPYDSSQVALFTWKVIHCIYNSGHQLHKPHQGLLSVNSWIFLVVVLNSPKNVPTFSLSGLKLVLWKKVLPEKPRFSLLIKKSAPYALINGSHLCSQEPTNDPDH